MQRNKRVEGSSWLWLLLLAAHKLEAKFAGGVRCPIGPSTGQGQASAMEHSGPRGAGTSPSFTSTRDSAGVGPPDSGPPVPPPIWTWTPGGSMSELHPQGYARVSNIVSNNGAQPQQEDAIFVFRHGKPFLLGLCWSIEHMVHQGTIQTYSPPLDISAGCCFPAAEYRDVAKTSLHTRLEIYGVWPQVSVRNRETESLE